MDLTNILEVFQNLDFKVMEPYQGIISQNESHYSAMQGIIHLIGWSIFIGILVWVFRYMKKHTQEDERMKKYYGSQNENKENQ